MRARTTDYGELYIGEREALFARAVAIAVEQHARGSGRPFTWALTGGSTPEAWYRWCVQSQAIPANLLASAHFTVSDERHVPLESDQSNFGNARRSLLAPLGVATERQHPWPVALAPVSAAKAYETEWRQRVGDKCTYDVCFLGMGDDAHTASLFPGSALLNADDGRLFAAVDVPQKGWRLTVTPAGLQACGRIVVMALGQGKATTLKQVMAENFSPASRPIQLLRGCRDRVIWLVDEAAASEL